MKILASVKGLETDFGIEAEIREKYGLVKEGEEVVVIIDEETKEDNNDAEQGKKGWWKRLKGFFNII